MKKIIEKIVLSKEKRELLLEETKENNHTLKLMENDSRGYYIHSKYFPQKEADRFFELNYSEDKDYFVIIGFGLGYHLKKFLKNIKKNQKLKVLIINPDIFLKYIDMEKDTSIIKDNRIELVYGEEKDMLKKLKEILDSEAGDGKIVINHTLLKAGRYYYEKIFDIIEKIDMDNKTVAGDKELIKINIKNNIECMIKDIGVKRLNKLYEKKPVFIVAAGPSLDINVDYLKDIGDKGVIIAVGTIAKALLKKDIKPDFIVIIDGLDTIYDQLQDIKDIPLLYVPGANSKAVNGYEGRRIVGIPDKDPYYEEIENIIEKGYLSVGGSVATAALDFSYQMGGDPIVFVGQDLALSKDLYTHAENTKFKTKKQENRDLREVKGINGDKVYTLKNLYHYLRWIEAYISTHNDRKYINASAYGADIRGTEIMDLEETIIKYCKMNINKTRVLNIINEKDNIENQKIIKLKEYIEV